MNRRLLLVGLVSFTAFMGCASPYRPPTAQEPHAVLKYRRVYERKGGTQLREVMTINDDVALDARGNVVEVTGPRIDAVLVHPSPAELEVTSAFAHYEMRNVQESYTVQEPYSAMESYNCGSGTAFRMCSRTVTRYRSVSRTRWVMKNVEVLDGSCRASTWLAPLDNETYLLELTYQDHGVCHLSCFEQTTRSEDGGVAQRPCPTPTAAEIAKIRED